MVIALWIVVALLGYNILESIASAAKWKPGPLAIHLAVQLGATVIVSLAALRLG